jgi:hypothetical protein
MHQYVINRDSLIAPVEVVIWVGPTAILNNKHI